MVHNCYLHLSDFSKGLVHFPRMSAVKRLLGEHDHGDASVQRVTLKKRIVELEQDLTELKEYSQSLSPAILPPPGNLVQDLRRLPKATQVGDGGIVHPSSWFGQMDTHHTRLPPLERSRYFNPIALVRLVLPIPCIHRGDASTIWERAASHRTPNKKTPAFYKVLHDSLFQAGRLQAVRVFAPDRGSWGYAPVLGYFTSPAPKLERLSLETTEHGVVAEFTGNLFDGYAPVLQTLELDRAPNNLWNALPFASASLTLLRLYPLEEGLRPAAEVFFSALSRMPHLESLDLVNLLPHAIPSIPGPAPVLPSLKTVILHDIFSVIAQFFEFVKVPTATAIQLSVRQGPMDVDRILDALETSCVTMRRGNLVDFQIHEHSLNGPRFRLAFGNGSKLELEFFDTWISLQFFVDAVHTRFDLSTVTTLRIWDTSSLDEMVWTDIISRLPKVATIIFQLSPIEGFVGALTIRPTDDGSIHHFPALSKIEFDRVHFNPDELDDPESRSAAEATISKLIDGLVWREEYCPIRELDIIECAEFFESDCEWIRASVPSLKVNWDRSTRADSWEDLHTI